MNGRRITRLAFAIVILSFALSTFVSMWSLRLLADQNRRDLARALSFRIYDSIKSELSEPLTVARSMARDPFLIKAFKEEDPACGASSEQSLARYLAAQKNAFGFEAAFAVTAASMCYYSYGGINKRIDPAADPRDRWYDSFVSSGKPYALNSDRDELSQGRWTVFANVRVEDENGNFLGVCGAGARMTGNHDLFVSLERAYGVRISLVNPAGITEVDTAESRIGQPYPVNIPLGDTRDCVYQDLDGDSFAVAKYIDNLGWYLVIESDGSAVKKELMNVLLLNVVLCVIVLIIMLLAIRIIIARTRALASASFIDHQTELMNRRAFEETRARLERLPLEEHFVYLTADVNGLKEVNDTCGHAAGDELIRGAADCLRKSLEPYGEVFRIGGDEFAAVIHLSESQLAEVLAEFRRSAAAFRGDSISEISVSCGSAGAREFPGKDLTQLIRIADERMYAEKKEHYRRTGRERRKTRQ